MRPRPLAAALTAALVLGACATRVAAPDASIRAYVAAIEAGNCARAATYTSASPDAFVARCEAEHPRFLEEALALRAALDDAEPTVEARVPLDRARHVRLRYEGDAWFLAEPAPLSEGGATPVDAMQVLAATLESDAIEALLGVLGADLRERYEAEIGALAEALASAGDGTLEVYGETAQLTAGEVTIRLVREGGTWRVSGVEQPYDDPYYYEDW